MGGLFLATLRDPLTAAERTLLVCRQLPRIECCSKILRGYQIGCQQFGLKRYLWFDLDGTLVDSVYQHILALSGSVRRREHRILGLADTPQDRDERGLFANQLLRETGVEISLESFDRLRRRHAEAILRRAVE